MAKNKGGRPTVMTPETVKKLEEVFAIGGSDEEACFWADISKQTLYDYQKLHPEYIDRKEQLKQKPFLKARQTVVKALENPQHAQWYLERKKKSEFASRQEHTGPEGKELEIIFNDKQSTKIAKRIVGKLSTRRQSSKETPD
jgi:hypothetical protein